MNEFLLIKLLHLCGMVYWLGGDLGVFYSSLTVTNAEKSAEVRVAAAKTLFALDQAPRICMTMMLPLGIHLGWMMNLLPLDKVTMTLIWVAAFSWMASVIYLHSGSSAKTKAVLTQVDFWFRVALAASLIGIGTLSLTSDTLTLVYWLAWKFIIFGGLIACGLMVRIVLREFGPAFGNLANGQPTPSDNAAISRSLGRVRPFVFAIWAGLVLSAALGIHLL